MVVRVVDVKDVDAVETQSLEALLERPHHTFIGEIECWIHRRDTAKRLAWFGRRVSAEQAADLAREREGVARFLLQSLPDAQLGEAVAIKGRGVKESDA